MIVSTATRTLVAVLSADVAFERTANAAAAAFAAAPPFVAYRVGVRASMPTDARPGASPFAASPSPTPPSDDVRDVVLRTSDDTALVRAAGDATFRPGPPLPLAPVVDALADWAFALDVSSGHVALDVAYERPHRYAQPSPAPGDAVVVASVNGYAISYADASGTHLRLAPATAALRAAAAQPDRFTYRDVWFDPGTLLPTRITLVAPGERFTLDYAAVAGHWLLANFTYDAIVRARRGPGRAVTIEATYSGYAFPAGFPNP